LHDQTVEIIRLAISQYVWPTLAVVITLALAILLHEFGHFIVARLAGVEVEIFSIGFGRKIWGIKGKSGTDYRISALPLGGYVKMRGIFSEETERYLEGEETKKSESKENGEPCEGGEKSETAKHSPDDKAGVGLVRDALDSGAALRDKPWPVRVAVFSAGCGFNFLVAVAAFAMMGWIGFDQDAPFPSVVGPIEETSALYEAGLRRGDRIVEFDGRRVETWSRNEKNQPAGVLDIVNELIESGKNRPIPCVIVRREKGRETTRTLTLPPAKAIAEAWGKGEIGPLLAPAFIGGVIPFSPAHKAGIKKGDIVVAIDDKPIEAFDQLVEIVSASLGKPLKFRLKRGEQTLTVTVVPKESPDNPGKGRIGVVSGNAKRQVFKVGFFKAWSVGFIQGIRYTKWIAVQTALLFKRFRYREMKENLAGPLGIFGLTFERAREGWTAFLFNMAILNIALMILNILPIPVLDGGHILITTVESITRRPIPPRLLAGIYYVFVAVILLAVVMATWIDLVRFANWFGIKQFFE